MADNIQRILEAVQPSVFIGKYIRLKTLANRQFLGLCPFHSEKTPSFRVNDAKGFYYCFGCSKGGTIITFLQDYKNITFIAAMQEIASEYGIKLEQFSYKQTQEEKTATEFLEEVTKIFESNLYSSLGKEALYYLEQKRGLKKDIIKNFRLGFCPKESDFLISYFPNKINELLEYGLIGKKEHNDFYNTFNDRIIFPILNEKSQVVGFGSRIYKKTQEDAKFAKYINSKESELFKKNTIIYGLEKAKNSKKIPILVEGYFDVITMHQFGFNSTIAQMGTAFSENQITKLFAFSNEIIFSYDSDNAGKKAEKRSIEIALPFLTPEKTISFLNLETKDCDEFLHKYGKEKMQERIVNKISLHQKIWQIFSEGVDFLNPQSTSLMEASLLKFCKQITNEILRKNYYNYFKNQLFLLRSNKKNVNKKEALKASSSTFSSRDAILFLLFINFPQILENDYYLEHFVPILDAKLQSELKKCLEFPAEHSTIFEEIKNLYTLPVKTFEDAIEFYKTIYLEYLKDEIKQEITKALKEHNFEKAKNLQQELTNIKS